MSTQHHEAYYQHQKEIEDGAFNTEETTCGKPHNNGEGDEHCLECQITIRNI